MKNNNSLLTNYLDTLSFMLDGASESAFVYSFEDKRIYFTEEIDKKYNLIPMTDYSYTSEELRKILKSDNDAIMFDFSVMTDPKRVYVRDYRVLRCDGGEIRIRCHIKVRFDENGNRIMIMGKFSDASVIHNYDTRTGLANNRRMLDDIKVCIKTGFKGYLMVLGIDNLKSINSRYGRNYGNQIMLFVAQILSEFSSDKIRVYSLDGDKFALLADGVESEYTVQQFYEEISEKISSKCTVSAGIAALSDDANDAELVYQRAENAMDQAKLNGKSTYEFFTEEIYQRQITAYNLSEELRKSVSADFEGFYLNFQPQISGKTFDVAGVEALLRYTSPTRGFVPPDEFIPILEQSGLIVDVGLWVLKNSLKQCALWRRVFPELRVSVNVSYVQLMEDGFADLVLSELKAANLSGDSLTLELTESIQLQDFQSYNKAFRKLEMKGIDISIDDFGTGYSSLNYLKSIDADEVKIDRCFIMNIQHSAYNYRLLSNTVDLAHSVEIRVCCEGVETEEELLTILQVHPDMFQGYLFSKPLSIADFEKTYINTESEEYKLAQAKKEHFCALEHRYNTENQQIVEKNTLSTIVDSMEEIVYVCSGGGYEMLYMNDAGRNKTGVYDYRGKKCYEVMMNRRSPCEMCHNHCFDNGEYKSWEMYNDHLKVHYLHKEKKIQWHGEDARLTISIDVTEKENLTAEIQDKLDFEQNIVACSKMLSEESDRNTAINNLLASIGGFYDAERAYLFEKIKGSDKWTNTFEWCADGVEPQIDLLQEVKTSATDRWESLFSKGEAIVVEDIDELKSINYDEWEVLSSQGIRALIVAPVWKMGEVIGFIGVDDSKKHKTNYNHIATIACFLADRLLRDRTDDRLNELLNKKYDDILTVANIGLWVIRLSHDGKVSQLYADSNMKKIIGITDDVSPEECYNHWYSRITEGYVHYVNFAVSGMIEKGNKVELVYTWNHPLKGPTTVRCMGVRTADSDGFICLEGYHHEINEIDMPSYMNDENSTVLEYNTKSGSVYFHNTTGNIMIEKEHETDFPYSWIKSEIVHPHYAREFESFFSGNGVPDEVQEKEILLKVRSGDYKWYRIKTRILSDNDEGAVTVVVLLEPAVSERAIELEYMRQTDFYKALLSETIAYAELDMETQHIISLGGLWEDYADEKTRQESEFFDIFSKKVEEHIFFEDREAAINFYKGIVGNACNNESGGNSALELRRVIDGELHWVTLTYHIFKEEFSKQTSALIYVKDIDSQKKRELANELAATRDSLTGLYNRAAFEAEVKEHMAKDAANCGALLMIDLDDFKAINDRLGHSEGDKALKQMANVLMITFRRKDIIGRLGGDEFLIFMKNVTDRNIIHDRVTELRASLNSASNGELKCSIGVADIPCGEFDYGKCVEMADKALYRSKALGKNTYSYFE